MKTHKQELTMEALRSGGLTVPIGFRQGVMTSLMKTEKSNLEIIESDRSHTPTDVSQEAVTSFLIGDNSKELEKSNVNSSYEEFGKNNVQISIVRISSTFKYQPY